MLVKTNEGAEVDVNLDSHDTEIKAHYESKGYVVKTAAEIKAETQVEADQASRRAHEAWEAKAESVLGSKKPDGVKGVEWFETAAKEALKPKEQQRTVADDVKDQQLKAVQDELETFKKNVETDKKTSHSKTINVGVNAALRTIGAAGSTPQEVAQNSAALDTLVKAKFRWDFDDANDLVAYDGDNIVMDPDTNQPMKFHKIVEQNFGILLPPKKEPKPVITGTGADRREIVTSPDGKKGIKASSTDEIREERRKLGIIAGTPEANEFFAESCRISGLDPTK